MTQESLEIIATFPIYKPFRRENYNYKRRLRRKLQSMNPKFGKKFAPSVEELNQFVFSSMESNRQDFYSIKKRKALEDELQTLYNRFANITLNKIQKMVTKDPEYLASLKAIRDIEKKTKVNLKAQYKLLKNLPKNVRNQIKEMFQDSQMILWDLPGDEIDRIIIGREVFNFINEISEKDIDISVIADELALASLAKHHVPLLAKEIEIIHSNTIGLSNQLTVFYSGFNDFKDQQEKNLLIELASVFLGKLLGIREPISLAQKIMHRYLDLESDIIAEAKEMGSDLVKTLYPKLIVRDQINTALSQSIVIIDIISTNSDRIRKIYNKIEESKVTGVSSSVLQEFCSFVSKIYLDLEEFRFITELFQDIPSYISMSGELVGEVTEKSEEIIIQDDVVIYAKGIFKTFPLPTTTVYALRGLDIEIKKGEFVAIMGPSGSGKTTLLNILSGLEIPDKGFVNVSGLNIITANEKELIKFRRDTISFIYQAYNLLPNFKNRENVQLPADLGTKKKLGKLKNRSTSLLKQVGLGNYIKGFPLRLSGGQQQRVTVARALMNNPDVLYADEPTGDLDQTTGSQIMDIIDEFHEEGVTIVLVTHDKNIALRADRIINMLDGRVIKNSKLDL